MIPYNPQQIKPELQGDYAVVVREDETGFFGNIRSSEKDPSSFTSINEELAKIGSDGLMDSVLRVYVGLDIKAADMLIKKLREKPRPTLQVLDELVLSSSA